MSVTTDQETAPAVSKQEALAMWPTDERPSLRTLNRYIADGKIRKQKYHNGRVKLVRADIEKLLTPASTEVTA